MVQKTCHSTAETLLFMTMQKFTLVHPVINPQWYAKAGLPFFRFTLHNDENQFRETWS